MFSNCFNSPPCDGSYLGTVKIYAAEPAVHAFSAFLSRNQSVAFRIRKMPTWIEFFWNLQCGCSLHSSSSKHLISGASNSEQTLAVEFDIFNVEFRAETKLKVVCNAVIKAHIYIRLERQSFNNAHPERRELAIFERLASESNAPPGVPRLEERFSHISCQKSCMKKVLGKWSEHRKGNPQYQITPMYRKSVAPKGENRAELSG